MKFKEPLEKDYQLKLLNQYKLTHDPGIREKLILHNLKLVYWTATRYYRTNILELDDLFQSGVIGLIRAIEGYDSKLGAFSTYAIDWIRQAIAREISNTGDTIRLSAYMLQEIRDLKKAREELIIQLEREPTPTELSIRLGKDIIKVNEIISLIEKPLSLDSQIIGTEEGLTLQDTIKDDSPTPDLVVEDIIFLEEFRKLSTNRLTRFQYDLIVMYCGLGHKEYSIVEIANLYNYKVEKVRQEKDKAFRILRRTRYFMEIYEEIDNRTSFIKGIDYSNPAISSKGYITSPVERLVLQREKMFNQIKKYKKNNLK